ncbi:MAG TPA: prolyl oligopeptidase family serine peptidase [Acidimicrobiales bacterium]|nr:prolyl oligopeptidase family serine peptidase [Acidimicrobiales bacterium]
MAELTFPRQTARTRRFTLGAPRDFTISPDGSVVLFLRSRGGTDPIACLYSFDVEGGKEKLLADPLVLLGGGEEELPPEERARRERARESSGGIVRYSADRAGARVAFDLSGRLFWVDVATETFSEVRVPGPVVDPVIDPTGRYVAYVHGGSVAVVDLELGGESVRTLVAPEMPDVVYGLAEFVAAEEFDRSRGFWWSPGGDLLLVARVDNSDVTRWHIADPARPGAEPVVVRYPAAGTANASVSLSIFGVAGGEAVPLSWDRDAFEYVVEADWSGHGLVLVVESRDQRRLQVLDVDPGSGVTSLVAEETDSAWVDVVSGVPARLESGGLVWTADSDDTRRLLIGGEVVSPVGLQVGQVLGVDGDSVLFSGCHDSTETQLYQWSAATGVEGLLPGGDSVPRIAWGRMRGGTAVVVAGDLSSERDGAAVWRAGHQVAHIESLAESPLVDPHPHIVRVGERRLATAVLFPSGYEVGSGKLPVLMDPYGGPHARRVLSDRAAFLSSQWFADQGFAVVVADGRGTPGRGPAFERDVLGDLAGPPLQDQVDALAGAAAEFPDLDLSRVAIRGWSFGGYLSALAVLRRPDVFHAAVAGAPVTDWSLYDTHYTERYLGDPASSPDNYQRSSLLEDAPRLERPLMIIHGLVDDNVVVAHSLRLSSALVAAGRPHTVLPLSGITHMASDEDVAENLLLLQLDFIRRALGIA